VSGGLNEWSVQCPHCGCSKRLADIGGVRYAAASAGKSIVAWCRNCRRFRWALVERAVSTRPKKRELVEV
jgi:hypothetical protein